MKMIIDRSFERNCYAVYIASDDGKSILKPEDVKLTEHPRYAAREPSFTISHEEMKSILQHNAPEDKLTQKELELTRNHLKDIQYLCIEKERMGIQ